MRGRTPRIRELLYVLSHSPAVCATKAALYIVNRQIVTTMLHKHVQSVAKGLAADDIELLGRAGIQSGSSRSGNPVSRSVNVRTDGAASFLSFSFFSFLAYVTTRRRLLRRVCVRTNGSTRHGIYTARHESNRRDRR